MRTVWLIPLLLVACEQGNKAPAAKPPAPAPTPAPLSLADPLALAPADSDLVVRVDVAAMRKSPLFPKYEKLVLGYMFPGFLDCNYDPFAQVTVVTAGFPMADEKDGIIVVRGLDRTKTLQCLRTSKADERTTAVFDGDFVALKNKSGALNLITFVDATTLVMQGSKNPTKESLTAALEIGAPLRKDARFVEVEKLAAPNAALTMMSRPGSSAFNAQFSTKFGAEIDYMAMNVFVTDRLDLRVAVSLAHPEDAQRIVDQLQPQFAAAKGYVEVAEANAVDGKVLFHVAMTEAQIKVIADAVTAMMGNSGN